jgi:ABC-type nickel/cobalt efflux system permease component RcnA
VKRFWSEMNPTLRGFLIIALIAVVIVALSLEQTVESLYLLARIAFFLAIAFVVYLFWRERRGDISSWSRRAQLTFYGAAALIVADLAVFFWPGRETAGLDAVAFLLVLAFAAFSMWRVWRDEHTYGY